MAPPRAASPLLPVTHAAPAPRRARRRGVVAALLRAPARAALGGAAFVAGAIGAAHLGLGRRSGATVAVAALGASQLVLFGCGAVMRRQRLNRAMESKKAAAVTNLMAWNEAVGAVRRIVDTFADGLSAPFTLKHLLLDMELIRRHHTAFYDAQVAREWDYSEEETLVRGRHFAKFAISSYGFALLTLLGLMDEGHDLFVDGAAPVDVVMHQLGLNAEDVIVSGLNGDKLGLPRHFVARDESTRSIVVVIRGTNSVSDVLVDLLCDSAPFASGYAHKGMRDAAQALYHAVAPALRSALTDNKGYSVVTAGHSLGAGVAMLLTKILLDNGFHGTQCYAISPPPVFGPSHAVDRKWSKSIECFVRCDDIVPCLSLASARALVMEIERIDALPLSDSALRGLSPESLRIVISRGRGSKVGAEGTSTSGSMKPESVVAPLFIPTPYVNWMILRPGPDDRSDSESSEEEDCEEEALSKFVSVRADSKIFSRMLITRSCVISHFPNSYVSAFDQLPIPPIAPREQPRRTSPPSNLYKYDGELGF